MNGKFPEARFLVATFDSAISLTKTNTAYIADTARTNPAGPRAHQAESGTLVGRVRTLVKERSSNGLSSSTSNIVHSNVVLWRARVLGSFPGEGGNGSTHVPRVLLAYLGIAAVCGGMPLVFLYSAMKSSLRLSSCLLIVEVRLCAGG